MSSHDVALARYEAELLRFRAFVSYLEMLRRVQGNAS